MSVIIFIIILGLIVFVHEMGHFLVAKYFGIRVDEFGMGFPPRAVRLFKRGETEYTLNWIPFGGFVKIHGEDLLGENDPDYERSLLAKKWWQQILVMIAGVTMNVILAWLLFSVSYMIGAPTPASTIPDPSVLKNAQLTILEVMPKSPADIAGIKAGDRIGKVFSSSAILQNADQAGFISFVQNTKPNDTVTIEIHQGKDVKEVTVIPTGNVIEGHQAIGVAVDVVGTYSLPFFKSIKEGLSSTYYAVMGTFKAFGNLLGQSFQGKASLSSISGPVGLVRVVHDAQKIGGIYLIILTAIISINLAVINILPFPALDGGRIFIILVEKIIRRPLPQKAVAWVNAVGFMILIGFMLLVTVKDIIKLF